MNSNIDKFGRNLKENIYVYGSGKRGPPGDGYEIDSSGHYTLNNKRLKLNSFDPINNYEAVNLYTLRKYTLNKLNNDGKIDGGNLVIKNVRLSDEPSSVVTKSYVDSRYPMSVKQNEKETVILCGNKRLVSLNDGIDKQDAVTLKQMKNYINTLQIQINNEIKDASKQIRDSFVSVPVGDKKN